MGFLASLFKRKPSGPIPLPILRTTDSPFTANMVHRPVAGNLGVFLAFVGPTPHGTVGINYLFTRHAADSGQDVGKLWDTAWENLQDGLGGKGMDNDGEILIVMERKGGFAASAVALPDFYEQMSGRLKARQIVAVAPEPDCLVVAAAGTATAQTAVDGLVGHVYNGPLDFAPCAFLLDGATLQPLAIPPAGETA